MEIQNVYVSVIHRPKKNVYLDSISITMLHKQQAKDKI